MAVATLDALAPAPAAADVRLVDAALACVARWGMTKTTLEDVAREARCSRATVYRAFPGGKEALWDAVVRTEATRFLDRIRARVEAAVDLEDALVAAISEAGRSIARHQALQYLLEHEPGVVLPALAFHRLDELLAIVRAVGGPLLARFVDDDGRDSTDRSAALAEWAARIALSYTLSPSAGVDTADEESVRTLVTTYVLPRH